MIAPQDEVRIGVYVCHCGTNIAGTVDVEALTEFTRQLPGVIVVKTYKYMCSDPGQDLVKQDIAEQGLNRVVVTACSPLLHEATFRKAAAAAGLNPFLVQMANIREQVAWVTEGRRAALEKAKAHVAAAVRRVALHEPLERKRVDIAPSVLIVGGGIAGIQAALTLAEAGKEVILVEREASIGGHMAMFDKTFPTLDCAACILTPKMTAVKDHPRIKLLTYSEVEAVDGVVGSYKVRVRRKARFVDEDKCIGCGECVQVCPVEAPSEFEQGLAQRKAIYRPFPQSVPNAFVIDKRGQAPCRSGCPAGVHTQGYIALIRQRRYAEAMELLRQDLPLPSVCGRVCYHPCEEKCERQQIDEPVAICALKRFVSDWVMEHGDQVEPLPITQPEKVAVVGSGPAGLACANELIRRGYAVTVFERAEKAGGMLRYGIPAYRLPHRVLDRELESLQKLAIQIQCNAQVGSIRELRRQGYRAVFLSTGAPLGMKLGVPGEQLQGVMDALDFLQRVNTGALAGLEGPVAVIGGGNSAMDAARSAVRLGAEEVVVVYRRSRAEMPAHDWEVAETEAEGVRFEFLAAPLRIEGSAGRAERLVCQRMQLGQPDESGRRRPVAIAGSEFAMSVRIVIPAIGQSIELAGMAQEVETTQRAQVRSDPLTLATSLDGVFAGGDVVTGPATVVDAFAAGKQAAESIDRYLQGKDLAAGRDRQPPVAPAPEMSGVQPRARAKPAVLPPTERVRSFEEIVSPLTEEQALAEAERCLSCGKCSECLQCLPHCEAGAIDHNQQDEIVELEVGTVIVATGFKAFDPTPMRNLGYGTLPGVYTSLEVERLLNSAGPTGGKLVLRNGRAPHKVAIIHCIGSRDKNHHTYCSRVCCMYSLKLAHLVKEKCDAEVYSFYIDMRTPGKGFEEFYNRVQDEGVHFIRGKVGDVARMYGGNGEDAELMVLQVDDTLLGKVRRLEGFDMVILSVGLEPQPDADQVRRLFGMSCSTEGFFLEKHPKLAPVNTANDGVYLAGVCQGMKDIPDTVAQADAAAAQALALIDRGFIELEPNTAVIDEDRCSGCRMCNNLCPYDAIEFDEEKKVSRVVAELCKGCGTCVAACPAQAITGVHFTLEQIFAEIDGVLFDAPPPPQTEPVPVASSGK